MLAKFVFPLMKYEGFVGLTMAQAKAKNHEYCHELKEHWKALKVQEPNASVVRAPRFERAEFFRALTYGCAACEFLAGG